jgi:hypothetical protein
VQEGGDAMTMTTEIKPEAVSERIKRAGELMRRWGWVELSVWTERMLTALDKGVKGGKWFSGSSSLAECLLCRTWVV